MKLLPYLLERFFSFLEFDQEPLPSFTDHKMIDIYLCLKLQNKWSRVILRMYQCDMFILRDNCEMGIVWQIFVLHWSWNQITYEYLFLSYFLCDKLTGIWRHTSIYKVWAHTSIYYMRVTYGILWFCLFSKTRSQQYKL